MLLNSRANIVNTTEETGASLIWWGLSICTESENPLEMWSQFLWDSLRERSAKMIQEVIERNTGKKAVLFSQAGSFQRD